MVTPSCSLLQRPRLLAGVPPEVQVPWGGAIHLQGQDRELEVQSGFTFYFQLYRFIHIKNIVKKCYRKGIVYDDSYAISHSLKVKSTLVNIHDDNIGFIFNSYFYFNLTLKLKRDDRFKLWMEKCALSCKIGIYNRHPFLECFKRWSYI